jgi:hypothetical protein
MRLSFLLRPAASFLDQTPRSGGSHGGTPPFATRTYII